MCYANFSGKLYCLSPGLEVARTEWRMFPWFFDGLVSGITSSHGISGVTHANPVVKREEENRVFEPRADAPGPERHHADPPVSDIHAYPPIPNDDQIHLSLNKPRG